jgi:hypothetical protein
MDLSEVFLYELGFTGVLGADNKCKAFVMEDSAYGFGVEEAEEVPVEFEVGVSGEFEGFGLDGGGVVGEEVGLLFVNGVELVSNFFTGVLEVAADVFHLEVVDYGELIGLWVCFVCTVYNK